MSKTYIELVCVTLPDGLALITEPVEKQKSAKAITTNEARETEEGKSGDSRKRQLDNLVERSGMSGVTIRTSQTKIRQTGDNDCEEDVHEPRNKSSPPRGLIHEHPFQPCSEAVQFVVCVGYAA